MGPWLRLAVLALFATVPACDSGRFDPHPRPIPPSEPPPEEPPDALARRPPVEGLATAVAGEGRVILVWDPVRLDNGSPSPDFSYTVYKGRSLDSIDFATAFAEAPPAASSIELTGLQDGKDYYFVVRAQYLGNPDDSLVPDHNLLAIPAVPRPVFYVDVARSGLPGDGLTPDTAFGSITQGLIATLRSPTGGNLWIAEGDYEEALYVPEQASLYGGFTPTFDPRDRSDDSRSRLVATAAGPTVLTMTAGDWRVVDGITVEGLDLASTGVRVDQASAGLVNVTVRGCRSDGIQIRSDRFGPVDALFHLCRVEGVGAEGIDLSGPGSLILQRCTAVACNNEGFEAAPLSVVPDGQSRLIIRSSSFTLNGDDGIDIDLNELDPATGGTSVGGRERILIEDCFVARNGETGILVDVDFDATDQIDAAVTVRGCRVRENALAGIALDADQALAGIIEGCRSAGNLGPGVEMRGDSREPLVTVVNTLILAQPRDALVITGKTKTLAAFCGFLFNGGIGATTLSGVLQLSSSVAWGNAGGDLGSGLARYSLFGTPESGEGNLEGVPGFLHAPLATLFPIAVGDLDRFEPPDPGLFLPGSPIEIGDDSVERQVTQVRSGVVHFDPPRDSPVGPNDAVFVFGELPVEEDLRPASGSSLQDAGLPGEQDGDGTRADIGVHGGPLGGEPGIVLMPQETAEPPFAVVQLSAAPGASIDPPAEVRFRFSSAPDPASLDASSIRIERGGEPVPGRLSVEGQDVVFTPDSPLTPGSYTFGIGPGVRDLSGTRVLVAFDYVVRVR
ncbi:MAG: right-handed parallel beta-helix repeat-containing protein [Planctomycetota bacterium]